MSKKEKFLTDFRNLLNTKGIDKKDIDIYCNILKKNKDDLKLLVNNYTNRTVMKYIINNIEDGWETATQGKIKFGDYILELCNYGDEAINIYKNNYYVKIITKTSQDNKKISIEEQINKIDEKIQFLKETKNDLLEIMS